MNGYDQKTLMAMSFADLAGIALWEKYPARARLKAWETLHARKDELAGVGWLRLSSAERGVVGKAFNLDLSALSWLETGNLCVPVAA